MHRTTINPWGAKLILATDRTDWDRLARRYDIATEPTGMGSTDLQLDTETAKVEFIVWIEPGRDVVEVMRTIVHESVHVAAMLLEHVGSTLHGESETLAYLAEWVAVWMMGKVPDTEMDGGAS